MSAVYSGPADIFAFLPYLTTQEAVQVGQVVLRSTRDLKALPDHAQHYIKTLSSIFFKSDGLRITDAIYAHLGNITNNEQLNKALRSLREAQLFILYLYLSPTHIGSPLLTSESCTLFYFTRTPFQQILLMGPATIAQSGLGRPLVNYRLSTASPARETGTLRFGPMRLHVYIQKSLILSLMLHKI